MSKKSEAASGVSTHDQCLIHLISLEICTSKSLIVWPISTARYASQHARPWGIAIHIRRVCAMVS